MSIGGVGGNEDPDAQASNTLAASGVVVVASAGNEGHNAFMTGSPGNATGVLSVAASDTIKSFPGATIDRTTGADLNGINQNDWPGLPVTGTLKVIADNPATGTPLGEGDEHSAASRRLRRAAAELDRRHPARRLRLRRQGRGRRGGRARSASSSSTATTSPIPSSCRRSSATPRRSSTSRWSASVAAPS